MRIHAKLVSFVVGALVVPFLLGVFYIRHSGRSYYQEQQGIVHLMIAEELAGTLENSIRQKFQQVLNWVAVSPLCSMAAEDSVSPFNVEDVQQVESRWSLPLETNEVLRSILSNPLSEYLCAFRRVNPEFAEILMTDRHGRLIGATNPTTDYWQADEGWWKTGSGLAAATGATEGLLYDASSDVLAIDMVFPVYSLKYPADFIGVLKVSLHARRFLKGTASHPWNKEISRDLILPDGRVLVHLNSESAPDVPQIPEAVLRQLLTSRYGWETVELEPDVLSLSAVAPVQIMDRPFAIGEGTNDVGELYVLVSHGLRETMMPVRSVLRQLTVWGVVMALLVAFASYLLATHWFARPIKKLRGASQSLVDYIKLGEQGRFEDLWEGQQKATRRLDELKTIRSGDELQDLSRDFIRMGERMISFLHQLQEKLAGKKRNRT
ncbi:MAG: hypothetical protein ISR85_02575 [Kiritimatiellales bacterium]|nr:hypothetical protein [Kiritimatiellota bacterium]MBL7011797.1 hypothetical protein [Kiritimatiellales bacterium]